MIVKLLCSRQIKFFRGINEGILKRNLCSAVAEQPKHDYKYLLILDFEATCDKKKKIQQEIIEFPCLKFNMNTLKEEARFHHYVKPVNSPVLTDFCVELTGILQEMVDEAEPFPVVYQLFEEWREKEGLTDQNSLYVTSGDWDLGHMIKAQCYQCDLERPSHMYEWADLKKVFANHERVFHNSFVDILRHYGLKFEGRQHSGIDDCLNMLRVIRVMLQSGIQFRPTSRVNIKTSKVSILSSEVQECEI